MKVLPSGCADCVLARKDVQTFGNPAGMSKQGDSPDCEYWRQLRERASAEQLTFRRGGAPHQLRMSVYNPLPASSYAINVKKVRRETSAFHA